MHDQSEMFSIMLSETVSQPISLFLGWDKQHQRNRKHRGHDLCVIELKRKVEISGILPNTWSNSCKQFL